jgi:hypothetical protein
MQDFADRLLREQIPAARERRAVERKPFVRPVTVFVGPNDARGTTAFSKDLSPLGIAIVGDVSWQVGQIATIEIHSLLGQPVRVRCEVRWCERYGKGWYVSGWQFLLEMN